MAFLNAGLRINFDDERLEQATHYEFHYEGGIRDFVRYINESKEALFEEVGFLSAEEGGDEVQIAFQWNTGYNLD